MHHSRAGDSQTSVIGNVRDPRFRKRGKFARDTWLSEHIRSLSEDLREKVRSRWTGLSGNSSPIDVLGRTDSVMLRNAYVRVFGAGREGKLASTFEVKGEADWGSRSSAAKEVPI